jgi:hypothetical protein
MLEAIGINRNRLLFFEFLVKCYNNQTSFTVARNRFNLPALCEYHDRYGSSIPYSTCYRLVRWFARRGCIVRDVMKERQLSSPVVIWRYNPVFIEFLAVFFQTLKTYKGVVGDEPR